MSEANMLGVMLLCAGLMVAAAIYGAGRRIAKAEEDRARVHDEIMRFLATQAGNPAGKAGYTPEDFVTRRDERMEAVWNDAWDEDIRASREAED